MDPFDWDGPWPEPVRLFSTRHRAAEAGGPADLGTALGPNAWPAESAGRIAAPFAGVPVRPETAESLIQSLFASDWAVRSAH